LNIVFYLFVALAALSVLVFFHELGHYTAARFFGVKIERFSIGFGKVLARKHCCDTEWVFSAIPLGGYVKMKGQNDADPLEKNSDPDSYEGKKPWQRIIILLAGPFANLVLAFFVYLYIALLGAPAAIATDYLPPVVGSVSSDSPAQKAGLQKNDIIIAVNGTKVRYWHEIGKHIQSSPDPVHIVIKRGNNTRNISLHTKTIEGKNQYMEKIRRRIIGIAPSIDANTTIHFHGSQILSYAWRETLNAATLIATGIKKMGTGEVSSKQVGGAITIFDVIMKFAEHGMVYLLFIMALISVNLGVLNLLPIPALDGGHIMFNLYELITRKPLNDTAVYYLTMLGWAILLGLMFLGLYNDIGRLMGSH
jgi:regulator of sigma E protease